MRRIATLALLIALLAGVAGHAIAQAPPAVPALPDSERRVQYSISASTGPFAIPFAVYGTGTDYSAWVEVWLDGTKLTATTDWSLSLVSGTLSTAARPLTNAQITLVTARTGTLQILGARRPSRTSQFSENRGVTARDLNQTLTDIVATSREFWDKITDASGRVLQVPPGETTTILPTSSARKSNLLGFDASGNPIALSPTVGLGTVVGPATSVDGHVAVFNGTTGALIKDGGPSVGTVNSITAGGGLTFSVSPCVTSCTIGLTTPVNATNGGTGLTSFVTGDIVAATSSGAFGRIAATSAGNVLRGNGVAAAPVWGQAVLTTDVAGTLPVGNGGTGNATNTIHGVLIGNSTSPVSVTTAGTTGQLLTGVTGADPTFQAVATASDWLANTSAKVLTTDQLWASGTLTTLPDGATVTPDFTTGVNFTWTLGAAGRTLANSAAGNIVGKQVQFWLVQDGTGGRTITSWGTNYKFSGGTKPTLSTSANSVDWLGCTVRATAFYACTFIGNFL